MVLKVLTRLVVAASALAIPLAAVAAESAGVLSGDWAFQPLTHPDVPQAGEGSNPIDFFIHSRLAEKGLSPAPPADRATLIRRMTFDLHGLPPTPDEVADFVNDTSANAVEKVIDRLLRSPRYGERWARHWLDVARFCESQGYERDKIRPNSWRYRDYVIHSLNQDKPYDQFVREQLAGDVMEPVTSESIVATGFLVAGPWDEVGANQQSKLRRMQTREDELEDMVSAVSQTFLGVTLNCARCHAHKFDPMPQEDYYSIKAVFEGVRHGDRVAIPENEIRQRRQDADALKRQITEAQHDIAQLRAEARGRMAEVEHRPAGPVPSGQWTFEKDGSDSLGGLDVTLKDGAEIRDGRLILNGDKAFAESVPLQREVSERTLEAWVILADTKQRGGGVLTIESVGGHPFDAIDFGEKSPGRWIAGSNGFVRTRELNGPEEQAGNLVHVAIAYGPDGSITFYRNGARYGETYIPDQAGLQTYPAGNSHFLLGQRHTGGGKAFLKGEIEEARWYDRALSPEEIQASFAGGPDNVTPEVIAKVLGPEATRKHAALLARIEDANRRITELEATPMAYAANPVQPEPTYLLVRGDVQKRKDVMTASGLSAIHQPRSDFGLPPDAPEAERRRRFANWVTHPANPLFTRSIVNRVWHYHFGTGIVDTPNDLGFSGGRPSHPELLDWLAGEFVREGFSLKRLHKLILSSETYQQSADFRPEAGAFDADDRLLWRFAPRRLEAESVRDAMLMLSGDMNWEMGGPGFQPFNLYISNSHFYDYVDKLGPEYNRRTVYRLGVQSLRQPLLDSLDCPDLSTKTPVRGETTTPIQALALMNDSFVLRQAEHFAERIRREAGDNLEAEVRSMFENTLSREPQPGELAQVTAVAREHGLAQIAWVLFNSTEFIYAR